MYLFVTNLHFLHLIIFSFIRWFCIHEFVRLITCVFILCVYVCYFLANSWNASNKIWVTEKGKFCIAQKKGEMRDTF
jgi:hypothetical protein